MKTGRRVFREGRHEQRMSAVREDSYRERAKPHDPTACPDCGAVYLAGRWTWKEKPSQAVVARCPACQRIHDDLPAGYVRLKGGFTRKHRDELIGAVLRCEERERLEHPLQRVMGIVDVFDGMEVTTTDAHLARGIAEAVHHAFGGDLTVRYAKDENLIRAVWKRVA